MGALEARVGTLEGSAVRRVGRRSMPSLGQHKLLVLMLILALAYCLGAPYAAVLIAHFGS